MFSAELSNVKLFRDSIDTISQVIDEGVFNIKSDGIEMVATDRAMVAVINFKMSKDAFDKFEYDKETSISLNLVNFLTILKRASNDEEFAMAVSDDASKLEVTIKGKSKRKFSLPLLEINNEDIPPISQLEFPASAEIKSSIIEQGIADADIIADSVIIELGDEGFSMKADGDSSKTNLNIEKNSESMTNLTSRENVSSKYPIDYLKKIIKGSKLAENAKIQLGTDYPMKIEFIGENVSLGMVLAPRVSEG